MKSVILLLMIVGVFEITNADPLTQLRLQLQKAKNNLDSITRDLDRTTRNLDFSTRTKISNKKIEALGNVNGIVNPALAQIRTDVDAAKANGKDAEHCYTEAKDSLRTHSLNAFSGLDKCQKDAESTFQPQLTSLQNFQATGNQLKNQLDSIFPSCYSSNIMDMQSCIAIKLGTANMTIRNLETQISSAVQEANRESNNVLLSFTSCSFEITSGCRSGTTNVRIATNGCIESA